MADIPVKTYNLASVITTLGGFRIEGFGDDDAVSYEMASDDVEDTVGADGQVTASVVNDNRVYVDITVKENSSGAQRLGALQTAQRLLVQAGVNFTPLPFLMLDPSTGETVESQYSIFKASPGPSKGKLAGERTWRLLLPNAKRKILYAPIVVL